MTTTSPYPGFEVFKQGAEGRVYRGKFLDTHPAILKERFSKKYRHPVLDEKINRERFRGEVRSLLRCKLIGVRTPTVFLADAEKGVLVMEYLENAVTSRDYIEELLALPKEDGVPRLAALGSEVGSVLGRLHSQGIIHGDPTTSNFLVEEKDAKHPKLCVIDFGLGFAEGSQEDKGVDLYVLERALLSTHPNTEYVFDAVLEGYKRAMKDHPKDRDEVMAKFKEIRMRGRKRAMVG